MVLALAGDSTITKFFAIVSIFFAEGCTCNPGFNFVEIFDSTLVNALHLRVQN